MNVLTPHDPGFDEARTGYQQYTKHEPALIVTATCAQDVVDAVARGEPVAVQSSGHGLTTAMQGGVLVATRGLAGVRVDAAARTAYLEAGASWQQVIDATAPHGLAPLSGSAPGVGAISYTLGGGVGLMARRYGFAADHVRRIDVVTAGGELRTVTDGPLFWALLGGGGNFGVVVGLEIALIPISHVSGGSLYYRVDAVPDVLDRWLAWTREVPDEMTSAVSLLPLEDGHVAQVQIASLVEGLRPDLGPAFKDTLRVRAYAETGTIFDEPDRPHAYRSTNLLVSAVPTASLLGVPAVINVRHLGGALSRPADNAVGRRDAAYSVNVLSLDDDVRRQVLAPLQPYKVGRSLNFSYGLLTEEEVSDAYEPADYQRLRELKAEYDPDVRFHANHPISPAR
jgi:FAD/FMN-containing dehydrogenase